jgi:tRNA threonylcarbamoyladenosine modification (KEOPS) complex  Pcc1 subunit
MAILLQVRMTKTPIVITLHAQDKIEMKSSVVKVGILRYIDLLLRLVTQLRWG